jgi:hypothetical protein
MLFGNTIAVLRFLQEIALDRQPIDRLARYKQQTSAASADFSVWPTLARISHHPGI